MHQHTHLMYWSYITHKDNCFRTILTTHVSDLWIILLHWYTCIVMRTAAVCKSHSDCSCWRINSCLLSQVVSLSDTVIQCSFFRPGFLQYVISCMSVGGGGWRRMSFSLSVPPLRIVHCYGIFITIWCVGDEFNSLSASQVSADSCMCCNWQLHGKATLVTVHHHSFNVIAVAMCCVLCWQKFCSSWGWSNSASDTYICTCWPSP